MVRTHGNGEKLGEAVVRERIRFQLPAVTALVAAVSTCVSPAFANTDNIPNRQVGINLLRHSLQRFWNARVDFSVNGVTRSGFATHSAADYGQPFWGDEAGSHCDSPLWDFQNSDGTPGALIVFLHGYTATGDQAQLRRAEAIGDTLLYVQDQLDGGWFQDGAVIDGVYKNVGVWGAWGDRRHDDPDLQGWFTMDDLTSQSCAMALLRLYQVDGEPRFLAGARRFADKIANLRTESWNGVYPYANGGIPQALPLSEAFTTGYQGNQDEDNPDGPYQPHKTLNDSVMPATMIVLMEMYAETGSQSYLHAIRLNVDYLLNRFEANGRRGWSQQYHWQTDAPCWGRGKEPPAYVTCETNVVNALLLWRERESDVMRRLRIELDVGQYLYWMRDQVPHPEDGEVWRYYNNQPVTGPLNLPVFASNYQRWVGAQYESNAAGGQPYRGRWDFAWADRLAGPANGFDFSLAAEYLEDDPDLPLDVRNTRWSPSAELPDAIYLTNTTVNGQSRRKLLTSATVLRLEALTRTIPTLSGVVSDSDGDGFSNADELQEGTDPLDSDDRPASGGGDLNCDSFITLSDIQPFVRALTNPVGYQQQYPGCNLMNADIDQNGSVNVNDISGFIDLLVSQ